MEDDVESLRGGKAISGGMLSCGSLWVIYLCSIDSLHHYSLLLVYVSWGLNVHMRKLQGVVWQNWEEILLIDPSGSRSMIMKYEQTC